MSIALPAALEALLPDATLQRMADNGGRLCLSGAASGADACWAEAASRRGDAVVHWSFAGHRRADCPGEAVVLEQEVLGWADADLRPAARALHRPWPPRTGYSANLLRRNHFQVAWAGSLYAVAEFDARGRISGGTAWTIALFLARFPAGPAPAFVFDQAARRWLAWRADGWGETAEPPPPEGIWAGIGTRKLDAWGAEAIGELLA